MAGGKRHLLEDEELGRKVNKTDNFDRFLPPSVAEKYNLDIPDYRGVDQVAEVPAAQEAKSEKVLKLAERQA